MNEMLSECCLDESESPLKERAEVAFMVNEQWTPFHIGNGKGKYRIGLRTYHIGMLTYLSERFRVYLTMLLTQVFCNSSIACHTSNADYSSLLLAMLPELEVEVMDCCNNDI